MAGDLVALLPFALGIATSPFPLIAAILVAFSTEGRRSAPAFLAAWLVTLYAAVGVLYLVSGAIQGDEATEGGGSVRWIRLVLGIALLGLAARSWRKRPTDGTDPELPGWMARIEQTTPARAARLGALLALNPKNLALGAGGATDLAAGSPEVGAAIVALAGFVVVASAGVLAIVGLATLGGTSARGQLERAKVWLVRHHPVLVAGLFLVLGLLLVAEALGLRG